MKRSWIPWMAFAVIVVASPAWAVGGTQTTLKGIDARIQTQLDLIDQEAQKTTDQDIAQKLSTQFDVTTDVLLQEKTSANLTWGEIFLAYTVLSASKSTTLTIDQILSMRTQGMTWMQIARSLNIAPGKLLQALRTGSTTFGTTTQNRRGGGSGSTQTRGIDRRLEDLANQINDEAQRSGDQTIATRLSTEFNVTTDVLMQEKTSSNLTWGDLFLAYTVLSKTTSTTVTIDQILALRTQGLTWMQIARQLRIPPGSLLQAVRSSSFTSDTKVARHGTKTGAMSKGAMAAAKSGAAATTKVGAAARLTHGQGAAMKLLHAGGHGK